MSVWAAHNTDELGKFLLKLSSEFRVTTTSPEGDGSIEDKTP